MERRNFLAALPLLLFTRPALAQHPEPRPGITAARVLPRSEVGSDPDVLRIFDQVRQIPQIVDGIRCYCGCAELPEFYSLLSCYEADGMARFCEVCRGEADLAFQLHKKGQSLDQIRKAIDNKFR